MQYHHVVATAGTSALQGANLPGRWLTEKGLRPDRTGRPERGAARSEWREEDLERILQAWRGDTPEIGDRARVSAEFSALAALRAANRLGPSPHVELIHSDTVEGRLAVKLVARLLEREFGAKVQFRQVGDLDPSNPVGLRRSLGAFMHEVASALQAGDPASTCFAPLGGYKVMTALGYVAGAFLRFPTVYLHEDGQILHEIPWVPIRVDESELSGLRPLFCRTLRGASWKKLSEAERRQVADHAWLFERVPEGGDGDELVVLNAFGHFLRQTPPYRNHVGTRIRGTPEVVALFGQRGRHLSGELDHLLRLLEEPVANRNHLCHEANFGHHAVQWHVYKGHRAFRAVYRWSDEEDTLDLRQVWPDDHEEYERVVRVGDVLRGGVEGLLPVILPS